MRNFTFNKSGKAEYHLRTKALLLTILSLLSFWGFGQVTVNFNPTVPTTTRATTWTCPAGVTSITVECWGGGGAGGGATGSPAAGGGGGGGSYVKNTNISVTPNTVYNIQIGGGGAGSTGSGGAGKDSWFSSATTLLAKGGNGGSVATANNSATAGGTKLATGNVGGEAPYNYYGGSGGTGTAATPQGGGGGSSAGTGSDGTNASGVTGAGLVTGGGAGINGSTTNTPTDNTNLGGGGSGGRANSTTDRSGGDGGPGKVAITYIAQYSSQLVSMSVSSAANWCAGETRNVTVVIKNIGSQTWTDGTFNIGVKWAAWSDYHLRQPSGNLAAGQTGTYTFSIKASNATGGPVYGTVLGAGGTTLVFDVVYEGVSWFGNNGGVVGPGNSAFTSATQTIIALPAQPTSGTPGSRCGTGTVNLSAVRPTPNTNLTIDWYDASAGGTLVGTGLTLTTPSITGTTTFYAETRNTSTGCVSATRRAVVATVNSLPVLNNAATAATCSGVGPNITLSTTPASTAFSWAIGANADGITGSSGGSGATINQTLTNPSNSTAATIEYNVTPTSTAANGGCVGSAQTITLTVNPKPSLSNTDFAICSGDGTNITLAPTVPGNLTWTAVNTANVSNTSNGTGATINQSPSNSNNIAGTVTYNVTTTSTTLGNCTNSSSPYPLVVTVNPKPAITTQNSASCGGTAFSVTPTNGGGNIVPASTVYIWGSPSGSGFSGGASETAGAGNVSGTLTNSTSSIVSALYSVTPTSSAALGSCAGTPFDLNVTINPKPIISTVAPTLCSGVAFSISPTDITNGIVPAGTTYVWSTPTGSGFSGGASGSGSAITGTLDNITAGNTTVTYSVTPTAPLALGGCAGAAFDVAVDLKPRPLATITAAVDTICTGNFVSHNFIGTGGSVDSYLWNRPAIATINGNIAALNQTSRPISEILNSSSSSNVNVTYAIAAVYDGCPGFFSNYVVTVRPRTSISPQKDTACNNVPLSLHYNDFSGVVPSDAYFTWNAPTLQSGLTGGGVNASPTQTFLQTLVNNTAAPLKATYIVTVTSATSCVSSFFTLEITVLPTLTVSGLVSGSPVSSLTATCSGDDIPEITLTSNVNTSVLSWTRDNTANLTGMTASGTNTISGSLTNITSSTQGETFHLTASVAGCSAPATVTVNVKPKPIASALASQPATCSDSAIQAISLSSSVSESATTYAWHRNNANLTGIGLSGTGSAITGSLAMINSSIITSQKDTFYIVPTANGCKGDTIISVVQVNPTPLLTVTPTGSLSICANNVFPSINLSSSNGIAGTTYEWTRDNIISVGGNSTGTGTPISEVFSNTSGSIEPTSLSIRALANGCYSVSQTQVVTVKPTPALTYTVTPASSNVCNGTGFQLDLDANLGSSYSFSTNNSNVTGFSQNVDMYGGTLINSTTSTQAVNVTGTATAPVGLGGCFVGVVVPISVYAPLTTSLTIAESQFLCGSANTTPLSITSTIGGSGNYSYQWQRNKVDESSTWLPVGTNVNTYKPTKSDSSYRLVITDLTCGTSVTSNSIDIVIPGITEPSNILGGSLTAPSTTYCSSGAYTAILGTVGHPNSYAMRYAWASTSTAISSGTVAANTSSGSTCCNIFGTRTSNENLSFSFTNTSNAAIDANLSIYARVHTWAGAGANGTGGFLCNAQPVVYPVRIYPTAKAAYSATSQTICSGGSPSATVHPLVTTATSDLSWSRSAHTGLTSTATSGTLVGVSSTTNTSLGNLFGTFTNTTTAPITTTITVYAASSGCANATAFTFSLTVNPRLVSGTIPAETICSGSTPSLFSPSLNSLTGGTISYYWQSGAGDCTGSFSTIGSETNSSYQPTSITSARSYRRITTFNNGLNCRDTTCVTITVNNVSPGTISANQNICNGEIPVFTNTLATSTSGSALSYQWESDNGSGYADIGGATTPGYSPASGLTSTTTFRRRVTADLNGNQCTVYNVTPITATVYTVTAGTIADPAPQCGIGNPPAITSLTPGSVSPSTGLSYRWLVTDGGTCSGLVDWDTVGTNSVNYDPPTINASKTYVRVAIGNKSGKLCYDTTTCKTIEILNISSGSITSSQSVCINEPADPFTSTGPGTSEGAFTYQWQDSTVSGTWQNISGASLEDYHYTNLVTESRFFRRLTKDVFPTLNCDVPSNEIVVLVNNPDAGVLTTPLCSSLTPVFTEQQVATGPGTLTYKWEQTIVPGCVSGWGTAVGSTSSSSIYTDPVDPGTQYFRRIVFSDLIGNICKDTSTCILVNAYDGTPGMWVGNSGVTGRDWFNCANWGAGFLPDNTTPVSIPSVTFKPIIDRTSSFITTTDSVAHSANLDVNDLLTFANSEDSLFVGGNLTIGAGGSVVMTNGGNIELRGHWTNNVGAAGFVQNSGNVSLTGTSALQHIITAQTFDRLKINHIGAGITLDKDVVITDSIQFVNGKVNTSISPNGLLTLASSAKATGASDNSFANGPVAKETGLSNLNSDFIFPIGKGTSYMPAGIRTVKDDGGGPVTYTGEYFASDPANISGSILGTSAIGVLQANNYWDIARSGAGAGTGDSARVILYYENTARYAWPTPSPSPASTNVAIVHYGSPSYPTVWSFTRPDNGFEVQNAPYEAIPYTSAPLRPVYSGVMSSFSPFTLAYGRGVVLPINLLSFDGRIIGTDGALSWKIADASDLAGFELQYSTDGITFRKLADVPANGSTVYSYLDKQLPIGARYYRLLVKEKSGNSLFSKLLVLTLDGQRTSIVGLANTIVREPQVTGKIISAKSQGVRALVSDVSGRQIKEQKGHLQAGTNRWLIGTGYLAQGMYFVTIITDDGVKATLQFVKE